MATSRKRPLAPALLIAVAMAYIGWVWLFSGFSRQFQFMDTYAAVLLLGLSLVLWFLLRSGLGRGQRLTVLALLAVVVLGLAGSVRIRGVTGDWVPVVEWRWAGRTELSTMDATPAGSAAVIPDRLDLSAPAAFTGYLGTNRDSTVSGLLLATDWEATPPTLLWQKPIGEGWSGFAIAGGLGFTLEQRGDAEVATAYRLTDGAEVWSHSTTSYFSNPVAGPGPRTTPAVGDEMVFTLGASGHLQALEMWSGKPRWRHNLVERLDARIPEHGIAASPLLVDDLVVVAAGGPGATLAAFEQTNGGLVWTAGEDPPSYSSPIVATLGGRRQIVAMHNGSVAGYSIEDGKVLWQHSYPADWPNVAPPVAVGADRVLFSTGYGIGARVFQVPGRGSQLQAQLVWESPRLKAKFTNPVAQGDSVYGLDDGVLVCIDAENGTRRWKRGRYGHGNLLLVGEHLLVQTEKGDIVLLEANPQEHLELGRFRALSGKSWNPFAVGDGLLLVRNDREMALWQLPLAG